MSKNITGSTNPQLETYKKVVEMQLAVAPKKHEVHEVAFTLSTPVFETYISELYASLENEVVAKGGQMIFTQEELSDYCKALVAARISWVRSDKLFIHPSTRVVIPTYLFNVLENLGLVTERQLGIELIPAKYDSPLTKEEVLDFSRKLLSMTNFGFDYSEGFSRDKYGSWDFMAMTMVEGKVLRHDDNAHLVYAVFASTLGIKGVEAALSPRCSYGDVDHLASLVRVLATLKGR